MEFQRATPALRSSDYQRTRDFYTDVLGFAVIEEGGDPTRFGIFKRDRAVLFINTWDGGPAEAPGGWDAYIHVNDLDATCSEVRDKRATVTRESQLTVYGMFEFEVRDPVGNVLCFGADTEDNSDR